MTAKTTKKASLKQRNAKLLSQIPGSKKKFLEKTSKKSVVKLKDKLFKTANKKSVVKLKDKLFKTTSKKSIVKAEDKLFKTTSKKSVVKAEDKLFKTTSKKSVVKAEDKLFKTTSKKSIVKAGDKLFKTTSKKSVVKAEDKLVKKIKQDIKKTKIIDLKKIKKEKIEEKLNSKKDLTDDERNQIIEAYLPMIESITKRISARLPVNIQHNDLISSAVIGLMDAIKKYDPNRNNKFKTYAEFRVRGAILDALRVQDWTPRSIRDKAKRIDRITKQLEQKLSRIPTEKEVAEGLNVTLAQYQILLDQTKEVNLISIDESSVFNNSDKFSMLKILQDNYSGLNHISKKDIQKLIKTAIKELPERQRIVLSLYYYEDFNLKKIGDVLKVTESRVSQLHAQAISRLRYKLINKIEKQELNVA